MNGPGADRDFTVVIPTRDRHEMLPRAVKSVLMQSHRSFELIVVDDGSARPVSLSADDGLAVTVIRRPMPGGPGAARNTGIEAATGRYVAFLDDDDEYHPLFLDRTKVALARGAAFSWCGAEIVDYDDDDRCLATTTKTFPSIFAGPEDRMTATLSVGSGFGLTVDTRCFAALGKFDTSFRVVEDMELFFRFLAAGLTPAVVPDPSVRIHNHHGGRLTDRGNDEARARECERLFLLYPDFVCLHPLVKAQLSAQIARLREVSWNTAEI